MLEYFGQHIPTHHQYSKLIACKTDRDTSLKKW